VPQGIFNNPNWFRTLDILYVENEFTGIPFAPSINPITNPAYPGMVVHVVNNQVVLADQAVDGGKFFGLLFSEVSSAIDECQGGTIPPVIIRGPATCNVFNLNSVGGNLVAPAPSPALSATGAVDLVAVAGLLKVKGAESGPAVATLNNVLSDRIEVQLAAPSV
jgi:hypothetical protein